MLHDDWSFNDKTFPKTLPTQALTRVAEVVRRHGGAPTEKFGLGQKFKPELTLFCRELRFVAIYALFFWRSLGKKSAFLGKNSASWARSALLHGIYCIF